MGGYIKTFHTASFNSYQKTKTKQKGHLEFWSNFLHSLTLMQTLGEIVWQWIKMFSLNFLAIECENTFGPTYLRKSSSQNNSV